MTFFRTFAYKDLDMRIQAERRSRVVSKSLPIQFVAPIKTFTIK